MMTAQTELMPGARAAFYFRRVGGGDGGVGAVSTGRRFGQLIYEHIGGKAWVHVSTRIPVKPSNRVITITGNGTQLGVQEGE